MLSEMLTGTRPFIADDTHSLLPLVLRGSPTPPRTHRPEIPADLEQVVLVAMRKNPRDRFDNARELSSALRQIARSGSTSIAIPVQASPALPSEMATKASRVPLDVMRTIEDPRKPDEE
jgi:serine/threonine-protein kinase